MEENQSKKRKKKASLKEGGNRMLDFLEDSWVVT
jgi:hypothetical protein